jgi:bacteriorhodopsin
VNIWDPFHPVAYLLHAILGFAGIFGAMTALAVVKGSARHILAGRVFAVAAAVAATTALVFSFTTFAPMAIASAVLLLSVVGGAVLAHREKSPGVAAGELVTTLMMAFVVLWLLYGVAMAAPNGGYLWLPPMFLACVTASLLVNDVRFMRLKQTGRELKRLPRHLSRMAFAFAIAIHEPIVVFSDDLNLHPIVAFYAPLIVWPAIYFFFNARLRDKTLTLG